MTITALTRDTLIAKYCETQECTPEDCDARMRALEATYDPDGFVLLECHVFGSSKLGERTIVPFGPRNTLKVVPEHPISPRGLASDMAVVVGIYRRKANACPVCGTHAARCQQENEHGQTVCAHTHAVVECEPQ